MQKALKTFEIWNKTKSKNNFFFFRLDSPELNFNFFCHSNIVVKVHQILIETIRDKKSYRTVYQKTAIFSIKSTYFLCPGSIISIF